MTKAAEAAPKGPAKKAGFSMSSMGALKAAAGVDPASVGRAALDDIEADPDQPREKFDEADLKSLAFTIKEKGVLQPIGLRPGVNAKWMIVWGERRWRASKLAGMTDIPFVQAQAGQTDYEAQVIENQQRAQLTNSEIAKAVTKAIENGRKNAEIAMLYNLKDYQISGYRAVAKFPPYLASIVDSSDMRGLYDLFRLTTRAPDGAVKAVGVQKALRAFPGGLTYADAQRIITALGGNGNNNFTPKADNPPAPPTKPEGKEVLHAAKPGEAKAAPAPTPAPAAGAPVGGEPAKVDPEAQARAMMQALASPAPKVEAVKIYVSTADGEVGRLVLDRRAKTAGFVIVQFESFEEEIAAAGLQIVEAS